MRNKRNLTDGGTIPPAEACHPNRAAYRSRSDSSGLCVTRFRAYVVAARRAMASEERTG